MQGLDSSYLCEFIDFLFQNSIPYVRYAKNLVAFTKFCFFSVWGKSVLPRSIYKARKPMNLPRKVSSVPRHMMLGLLCMA